MTNDEYAQEFLAAAKEVSENMIRTIDQRTNLIYRTTKLKQTMKRCDTPLVMEFCADSEDNARLLAISIDACNKIDENGGAGNSYELEIAYITATENLYESVERWVRENNERQAASINKWIDSIPERKQADQGVNNELSNHSCNVCGREW